MTHYFFESLPHPVFVTGCGELRRLLTRHFARWPFFTARADTRDARPLVSIRKIHTLYRMEVGERERVAHHHTSARLVCDLGIDLAQAVVRYSPSLLCLHCSAVAVDGKLVVFPNVNRAGKSLLAACFPAHGHPVFADDLLAVTEDGRGYSFGLPPRLRLPLPPSMPGLRAFVEDNPGLDDGQYRFLYPPASALAAFGESLPIGAIVIPERKDHGKARLTRISGLQGLRSLVYQFQMPAGQAHKVFDRAQGLAENSAAWLLSYSSADEAAEILLRRHRQKSLFDAAAPESPEIAMSAFRADEGLVPGREKKRTDDGGDAVTPFCRRKNVAVRRAGNSAYLLPEGGEVIFYLNPVAFAVWQLLDEPLSGSEAVSLLATVYPDLPLSALERDIDELFANLRGSDLIIRA